MVGAASDEDAADLQLGLGIVQHQYQRQCALDHDAVRFTETRTTSKPPQSSNGLNQGLKTTTLKPSTAEKYLVFAVSKGKPWPALPHRPDQYRGSSGSG